MPPTNEDSPTAGELNETGLPRETGSEEPETNFPTGPTVEELAAEDEAAESGKAPEIEAPKDSAQSGQTWATWNGSSVSERRLTVADQKSLGHTGATEDLVWNRENLWQLDVTDVPPLLLRYIEKQDGSFTVERF